MLSYDTLCDDDTKFLTYKELAVSRRNFLFLVLFFYFGLGSGYYTFPVWLSQILKDQLCFTREEETILGGLPYITLGLCGSLIVWFTNLGLPKIKSFNIMTTCAATCILLAWSLLAWLILYTEQMDKCENNDDDNNNNKNDKTDDENDGNDDEGQHRSQIYVAILALVMVCIGLGIGAFYMVWIGQILTILKPKWHHYYLATMSMMFTLGATVILCFKLFLSELSWILLITLIQFICVLFFVQWVFRSPEIIFPRLQATTVLDNEGGGGQSTKSTNEEDDNYSNDLSPYKLTGDDNELNKPPPAPPSAPPSAPSSDSTLSTFKKLVLFQSLADLPEEHNPHMSHVMFYLLLSSFIIVLSICTNFMANIGPLTSNEGSYDDNKRAQLLVIISVTAGQCFGRLLVPLLSQFLHQLFFLLQPFDQNDSKHIIYLQNNITLILTILISVINIIALLSLEFISNSSFLITSTGIAVSYGMMWSVTSNYPLFFENLNFSIILSIFQTIGAMSTLGLLLIIALLHFNNEEILLTLLVGSFGIFICSCVGLVHRYLYGPNHGRERYPTVDNREIGNPLID